MKKCFLFAVVCLVLSTGAGIGHADPWADQVVSYAKGTGGVFHDHAVKENVLGQPNYDYINHNDGYGYTSLGWGGTLVLKFTDNYLTTSGNSDKDLWIYEIGDEREATHVYISTDMSNWISVGDACGDLPYARSGIDIDAYIGKGVEAWVPYYFVKLVDVDARVSKNPWAGADIDAVAGYSTKPPVSTPEPGILLILGIGLVASASLSKKK